MSLRFLLFLCLLLPLSVFATHNRAGEIIVTATGCETGGSDNEVCARIITYTEIAVTEVDREALIIFWGDGSFDTIPRVNGPGNQGEILPNGFKKNEYVGCHEYGSAGTYFIYFEDENRVASVQNIPSSVSIPFSVSTTYTLLSATTNDGCNNSPILAQPPLDNACVGSVWTHNPGAFDPDGDSLSFFFVVPTSGPREPINNFIRPNQVGGGSGTLEIDENTGQITWDAPEIAGEYNLAFAIVSYRDGFALDTLVRDMQIQVIACANDPPELEIPREEICVTAGELIEFDIFATAPLTDTDQRVQLTATGGPFEQEISPATFLPDTDDFFDDPVGKTFSWQTTCDHISDQEYFVVIRAEDNFFSPTQGLATLKVISIKVVAPAPQNLQADADDDSITVTWESPYACEEGTEDIRFFGFFVYRREGSANFAPDTCETGLEGRGYTLLNEDGFEVREEMDGRYFFVDTDVKRGRTYCYRIVASLGIVDSTNSGEFLVSLLESLASEELCVQLSRDIPLLTEVDVTQTGADAGAVAISWILPDPEALDTNLNRGPYRYVLSRTGGQTEDPAAFEPIATFTANNFGDPVETSFLDEGLNTTDQSYSYLIELFVEDEDTPINAGQSASTVRLDGAPTDRANALNWTEVVPWSNYDYTIFRRDPDGTSLDSIGTTAEMSFRDEGLENGLEYCYVVRSEGTYGIEDVPDPLFNRSQEVCLTPFDNVAPCPPELAVTSVCDQDISDCSEADNLFNTLEWRAPVDVCGDPDVAGYRIYFINDTIGDPRLVGNIEDAELLRFDHRPEDGITGCYFVTAVDVNGNESDFSNRVCVTNCPIYELPNVFTPNGDGQNDRLVPRRNCFIERVSLKIYNRWGAVVYETEDPGVNWDGVDLNGNELSSGTYYYVAQIFERRLEGIVGLPDPISGYVELIRGAR